MTFKIITFGCKVNSYESEFIKEQMEKEKFTYNDINPDIIIVNTCSVTNVADNKSLKAIRSIKKNNPNSIIVVCGCSVEHNKETYKNMSIDVLIGNRDKSILVKQIKQYIKNKKKITDLYEGRDSTFENMSVTKFSDKTRAFVKIQDGCDNFCTYCIIPYVRGSVRSKDFTEAVDEIKNLVAMGHQEIVFTGIDTGSYGKNTNHDLVDLIKEISKIENLKRIRISSIEITSIDDRFIEELKTNPKVCGHLHVSLQSGSKRILKLMNRKYTKEDYLAKINKLRAARPNINLTTDVIVGFPSETESDFKECIDFCKLCAFSKIHVFPYSKREGTAAAIMANQIDNGIKKQRARELIKIDEQLQLDYNKKFLNQKVNVLIEESNTKRSIGHTENYLKVIINKKLKENTCYDVIITAANIDSVNANLIKSD